MCDRAKTLAWEGRWTAVRIFLFMVFVMLKVLDKQVTESMVFP